MVLRKGLVGALAALLAVTGCTLLEDRPTASESPPTSQGSSAPEPDLQPYYTQSVRWSGCGGGFVCATVRVPMDYAEPSGSSIGLAVVRRPASGRSRGSLVLNPGGPGVSGADYARAARVVTSDAVRAAYDIVGFDPRGVVASDPVDCVDDAQLDALFAQDATPDDQGEVDALAALSASVGAGCRQRSPELAASIDTVTAARDMDILRAVLGDEKLHYLGASYGTLLGAWYAEQFPDRVGRFVLEGVLPSALDGEEIGHGQAVAFDVALRRFVTWCIAADDCPLPRDVDQGVARVQQFLAGLDSAPLPGIGNRQLTQALGTFAVYSHLYYPPRDWIVLQYGLEAAFNGDGSVLVDMVDDRTDRTSEGTFANNGNEAYFAISCLDRPGLGGTDHARQLAESWAVDAPTFGPSFGWGTLTCWQWPLTPNSPVAAAVARDPQPLLAAGAGPFLVVSTRYDPATPYQWGVQVAGELEDARLLTYEADGHGAYRNGSSCVDAAVDAYLLDGTLPAEGTVCPPIPMPHEL